MSFDYRRDLPHGTSGDLFRVYLSSDGTNFTQIETIGGGTFVDGAYSPFNFTIAPSFLSAHTTVRFSVGDEVNNGNPSLFDVVYIDNIKIDYVLPSSSYAITYFENGAPLPISANGNVLTDSDDTQMQSATIKLNGFQPGDMLSVIGNLPGGITPSAYNSMTGVLTLTGAATLAEYAAALHQVGFSSTSDNPGNADRTISVTVFDGIDDSNTATVTVHVNPGNDAPVITWSSATVEVAEGSTAVTTITATDADSGTTLTYSIVGGADEALFSINSVTGALAFNAAPDYEAPSDQGGDNIYDVTVQVSDGALSDSQAITVSVTDANDAPTVAPPTAGGAVFDSSTRIEVVLDEPDTNVSREIVFRTTVGGGLFSVDNGDGSHDRHLVITADGNIYSRVHSTELLTTTGLNLNDGNTHKLVFTLGSTGTNIYVDDVLVAHGVKTSSNFDWDVQQIIGYSADGDGSFTPNNGPSAFFTGTIESYRGWDTELTSAQATGQTALPPATHEFDFAAYSNAVDLVDTGSSPAAITVEGSLTLVASSAAPSLATILEDTVNPPGATVDALFANKFDDIDSGASFAGIIVASNNANPATEGVWQYWCDGLADWAVVGDVSLTGALVLPDDALLRFVPAANFNGEIPGLAVHGLDNSYAGSFTHSGGDGEPVRAEIDISTRGGSTPFSADNLTLATTVTPVSDGPAPHDDTIGSGFVANADTIIAASALLANDVEPDGDPLTIVAVGNSLHAGTVTFDGTFVTYHPVPGFTGNDFFVYTVSDGQTTANAAVMFTVMANQLPAAQDDHLIFAAGNIDGSSIAFPFDFLAANDDRDGGDEFTSAFNEQNSGFSATTLSGANVSLGFGGVIYDLAPNQSLPFNDSFTYDISIDGQGNGAGDPATVTLSVVTGTTLTGGATSDILVGSGANETLTGGAGIDGFVFMPGLGNDNATDFTPGVDKIVLANFNGFLTNQVSPELEDFLADPTEGNLNAWKGLWDEGNDTVSFALTYDQFGDPVDTLTIATTAPLGQQTLLASLHVNDFIVYNMPLGN